MIVGRRQKVILQGLENGLVFEADAISTEITMGAQGIDVMSMPIHTTTEIRMVVVGSPMLTYDNYMTSFRTGDIWRCSYCSSENPKRAKINTWRDMQEITHCLKCGAPRHIAYG